MTARSAFEAKLASFSERAATVDHRAGAAPIPTEHELLLLVWEGWLEEAVEAYRVAASRGHRRCFEAFALRTMAIFRMYYDGDAAGAAEALWILVPHGSARRSQCAGEPVHDIERQLAAALTAQRSPYDDAPLGMKRARVLKASGAIGSTHVSG